MMAMFSAGICAYKLGRRSKKVLLMMLMPRWRSLKVVPTTVPATKMSLSIVSILNK
jgi:hypothetical protein